MSLAGSQHNSRGDSIQVIHTHNAVGGGAGGCRALLPRSASACVSLDGSRVVLLRGAVLGLCVGAFSFEMSCLSARMARVGTVAPVMAQLSASVARVLRTVPGKAPLWLFVLGWSSFL